MVNTEAVKLCSPLAHVILEPDIASVELRRGANADGAVSVARPLDKLVGIVQTALDGKEEQCIQAVQTL